MADSSSSQLRSSTSGSAVLKQPFQHLIQHIKQLDPMLYEALRRLTSDSTDTSSTVNDLITNPPFPDKCTFGLVQPLTVSKGLTNYYICRKGGSFIDFATKIKTQAPTGSSAILDVLRSTDDGATWGSIFGTSTIVLPAGSTKTVLSKTFNIVGISVGDLLRIDCLQIGSTNPGSGIEVVGRWQ